MALMGAYTKDEYISRDEMRQLPLPEKQGPWHHPVPFVEFVDLLEDEVNRAGMVVASEEHYLQKENNRHFGVMSLAANDGVIGGTGWTAMLGIRGSHDRSVSRGLAFGKHVGVCSNGMFNGDLGTFNTKQTTNIWDRLRELVRRSLAKFPSMAEREEAKLERMMNHLLSLQQGDAVLAEVFRHGGLSAQQLGHALKEWQSPTYVEHIEEGRNAWLLEQAVTEAVKPAGTAPVSPFVLAEKTEIANRVIAHELRMAA